MKAYLISKRILGKNIEKNIENFKKISSRYLSEEAQKNIFRILEIQGARKSSPIEYQKNENIILLIGKEYKILTIERLRKLVDSLEEVILKFNEFSKTN